MEGSPLPQPGFLRDTEKATSDPRGKQGRRRLPTKRGEKKKNEKRTKIAIAIFVRFSVFFRLTPGAAGQCPARDGGLPGKRARVHSRGPCPPHGRRGGGGRSQPLPTTKIAASPCGRGYFIFNRKQKEGKGRVAGPAHPARPALPRLALSDSAALGK